MTTGERWSELHHGNAGAFHNSAPEVSGEGLGGVPLTQKQLGGRAANTVGDRGRKSIKLGSTAVERRALMKAKIAVTMAAFDINTVPELLDKLYPPDQNDIRTREAALSRLERYARGANTTPDAELFDRIRNYLPVLNATKQFLLHCSIIDFFDKLCDEHKAAVRAARTTPKLANIQFERRAEPPAPSPIQGPLAHGFASMLLDPQLRLVSNEDLQRAGRVDQRRMYASREAVENWEALLRCGLYPVYQQCEDTLRMFCGAEKGLWRNIVEGNDLGSVVFLGAGAPDKEIVILNDLFNIPTDRKHPTKLLLIDSSFFMLKRSIDALHLAASTHRRPDRADVTCCHGDFMNLRPWKNIIRGHEQNSRTIFFLLGNTIGNIDEVDFLNSLRTVSRPGDILIVGGDFLATEEDITEDNLVRSYNHDAAKDMVLESVRVALDNHGAPIERSSRRAQVIVRKADETHLSRIPGTVAVEMSIQIGEQPVTLALSKKYRADAFTSFMAKDFEALGDFPSGSYRQMVFQKAAPQATATKREPL